MEAPTTDDPTMITRLVFDGRGLLHQEDHDTGEYVAGWPAVAAEAVRALNHLTIGRRVIAAPTVYDVLDDLSTMAHRLPQGLTQLAKGLERSGDVLTLTDSRGDPRLNIAEAGDALARAAALAKQLAAALDEARLAIGEQGYE